jgi:adenine-specific DNA-methyltransferase
LDDVESHYLKVLCDDIFSRECFVTEVEWRHSDNSNNNALTFSIDTNHILVYSKKPGWKPNFLNDPEKRKHFNNPDNDPRGAWFDGNPVNNPGLRPNLQFDITTPKGNTVKHPPNGWRWSKETMDEKFATGELRFSDDETRVIRRTYLNEMEGLPPSTLWTNFDVTGHTRKAKYELKSLFPEIPVTSLFATPKPELLLNYIFDLATISGDLVLDFFLGSGTTCAVAHKKKLRYIGIEQMDYIDIFAIKRLTKVIEGEQGGISKTVNWHGGGSFVYCELAKCNQQYVDEAMATQTDAQIAALLERIMKSAFISSKVMPSDIADSATDFESLSLEDKKRFIIELLDKNMLYVNLCDIDDEEYAISEADKAFTRSFYGLEGK